MKNRYYVSIDVDPIRKGYRLVLGDLLTGKTKYIDKLYDDYYEAIIKARRLVEKHSISFRYCLPA